MKEQRGFHILTIELTMWLHFMLMQPHGQMGLELDIPSSCFLYELNQLDCLASIPTEVGKRWHLCERGLRLIAAANRLYIRNIATLSEDET